MRNIGRGTEARRDLIAVYRHDVREAGIHVADRFLAAAEATFQRLSEMPNLGTRHDHDHPALAELRVFSVGSRFKVYQVFYLPIRSGIKIVRVLHGARDIQSIIAEEFGIADEDADSAE